MKPAHDDITKAEEVYIQPSFKRYKENLMLGNQSPSVYMGHDRQKVQYGYVNKNLANVTSA